ncbi:MAG: HU family DNA-binding protein [Actinobacteria bacterium]|nr:HU family DNA-binding protein [Actinomycetota bacterium]
MNRTELIGALAERTESDKKTATAFLNAFTEVVTESVSKGDPVAISGFAKFAKVFRPERQGRNPATGETITIKASNKVRITPLKAFKDAVLASR